MKQIWRPKKGASAAAPIQPRAAENTGGANRGRWGEGSANALEEDPVMFLRGPRQAGKTQVIESMLEAGMGIEPINGGFANHCLTGWLPRRTRQRVAND